MASVPCIGYVNSDDEEEHDDNDSAAANTSNFPNSEAFLAALELYNRDGCSLQTGSLNVGVLGTKKQRVLKQLIPSRMWKCREVAGQHRKPCDECGEEFEYPSSTTTYYLTEEWSKMDRRSYYHEGNTKLCFACMDRILNDQYGTDLSTIKERLKAKRQEHRDCNGVFSIKEYEKEYPNYPVFLRHLPGNDKEKGERVQMEMMRGVSQAMLGPIPLEYYRVAR